LEATIEHALWALIKHQAEISNGFETIAVRGPLSHQYPTLLKMIGPMISSFNFDFTDMSKRSFTYCAWYRGRLFTPVSESGAEAMDNDWSTVTCLPRHRLNNRHLIHSTNQHRKSHIA
jgi:hypothetical protein